MLNLKFFRIIQVSGLLGLMGAIPVQAATPPAPAPAAVPNIAAPVTSVLKAPAPVMPDPTLAERAPPAPSSDPVATPEPHVSVEDAQAKVNTINSVGQNFSIEGTVFASMMALEKEKALAQIENDKAKLNVDKKKIEIEQVQTDQQLQKLNGTIATDSKKAEADKQKALDDMKAALQSDFQKQLAAQKQDIDSKLSTLKTAAAAADASATTTVSSKAESLDNYHVVQVSGSTGALVALVENTKTQRQFFLRKGKKFAGYDVISISIDEGITLKKGDEVQTLLMN